MAAQGPAHRQTSMLPAAITAARERRPRRTAAALQAPIAAEARAIRRFDPPCSGRRHSPPRRPGRAHRPGAPQRRNRARTLRLPARNSVTWRIERQHHALQWSPKIAEIGRDRNHAAETVFGRPRRRLNMKVGRPVSGRPCAARRTWPRRDPAPPETPPGRRRPRGAGKAEAGGAQLPLSSLSQTSST